jgi:hypothetical protein
MDCNEYSIMVYFDSNHHLSTFIESTAIEVLSVYLFKSNIAIEKDFRANI